MKIENYLPVFQITGRPHKDNNETILLNYINVPAPSSSEAIDIINRHMKEFHRMYIKVYYRNTEASYRIDHDASVMQILQFYHNASSILERVRYWHKF